MVVLLIATGVVGGLIFAYLEMSKERAREAEREKPVVAQSRVKLGPNGEPTVTLDGETQKRIALKVEAVATAKMIPELKGYGRVLDPAPMATVATELASAQAALTASQKEFDRSRLLNEQKNASDRALQAAEAAARRDQILVESVRTRLVLAWGKAIAERADLPAFLRSLTSLECAVVRIDLPAGEVTKTSPTSARIVAAAADETALTAEFLGPVTATDPQTQGQGFLFLVKAASPRLAPGTAVAGYLRLPGEPQNGFIVPDSSVVRQAAQGWIYVQTGDDTFRRRKIPLDHPTENGWFVREGVAANEKVVVRGAQALLSEEQKYQIKLLE
jgi:hypothetical protein